MSAEDLKAGQPARSALIPDGRRSVSPDAIERFNAKWKADENGCHVWQAATRLGYGLFRYKGRMWSAHRWALEVIADVELVDGLQCDHSCNNGLCVNVRHIRQVTPRENCMAKHSNTIARLRSEQTHCKYGHAFNNANTIRQKSGTRKCRECGLKYQRSYNARRRLNEPDYR